VLFSERRVYSGIVESDCLCAAEKDDNADDDDVADGDDVDDNDDATDLPQSAAAAVATIEEQT